MNILARNLRIKKGEKGVFIATVMNDNFEIARNVKVNIALTNQNNERKVYYLESDLNGLVKLPINLGYAGIYTLTTYYKSDECVNTIEIFETVEETITTDKVIPTVTIAGTNPIGKSFDKAEIENARKFIQTCIKEGYLPSSVQMKTREDNKIYEITKAYYAALFESQNIYIKSNGKVPNYVTLNSSATCPNILIYQPNSWTCGSTSAAMAIQSCYGLYTSETVLRKVLGTGTNGTDPSAFIGGMKKLGYKVTQIKRDYNIVKKALESGKGVIMHYQTGGSTKPACTGFVNNYGHYMCCYKAEDNKYYLMDPTKGFKTCPAAQINNATNNRSIYYFTVELL